MLGMEKRLEFFFERFDFFERAVHQHQPLAAIPRTLHGNRPPRPAASPQQHDSQIPHIHAEFLAYRANEPRPVGVEAMEFFANDHDGIHAARDPSIVIGHIHRRQRRRLVGNRDICPEEARLGQRPDGLGEPLGRNVQPRVSSRNPAGLERRILKNGRA